MGCGKSKLDVVSRDAISSKRSNASKRSSKDRESVVEGKHTTTENIVGAVEESAFVEAEGESQILFKECDNAGESKLVKEQEFEESKNVAETKLVEHEDQIQSAIEEDNAAEEAVVDSKSVDENGDELKQEMETEIEIKQDGVVAVVEDQQEQPGRLISKDSPHHFFSSRKDEDAVAVAEADAKSEYESPTILSEKEGLFYDQNSKLDDDVVVVPAESNKTVVGEKKQESGNGESVIEKEEEDSVKEGKTDAAVEPEVASQTEEKKIVQWMS